MKRWENVSSRWDRHKINGMDLREESLALIAHLRRDPKDSRVNFVVDREDVLRLRSAVLIAKAIRRNAEYLLVVKHRSHRKVEKVMYLLRIIKDHQVNFDLLKGKCLGEIINNHRVNSDLPKVISNNHRVNSNLPKNKCLGEIISNHRRVISRLHRIIRLRP